MEIKFPQYRKYKNERSFFKIGSRTQWEEIRSVGSKFLLERFEVKILPDRNFIHDLLFDYKEHWVEIDAAEYETMRAKT